MLLSYAEEIKKRVRGFFKQGRKSSNKKYGEINRVGEDRAEKRANDSLCSLMHMSSLPPAKDYYEYAKNIIKMEAGHQSGNCTHMTSLSVYYLIEDKKIEPNLIYIATLKHPGDHAFCLVSKEKIGKQVEFSSVLDFSKSELAPSCIIIDPWLNVACRANDYVNEVHQKLDKWTADGKRILWSRSKEGFQDWYVPNGEYREALVNAPLELTAYQS